MRSTSGIIFAGIFFCGGVCVTADANALPITAFTPGSLLVNTVTPGQISYQVTEYMLQGSSIQNFSVPQTQAQSAVYPNPRDMVVDSSGKLHVFNGSDIPYLSSYDPSSGTWDHITTSGWRAGTGISYGGIASWKNSVFVTSFPTGSYGLPNGTIYSFDLLSGTATHFGVDKSPIDLNMGLNGKLYVLNQSSTFYNIQTHQVDTRSSISVYDPQTKGLLDTIFLTYPNGEIRSIAIDAFGDIFAANSSWVYKYDSTGTLIDSAYHICGSYYLCNFMDIDISESGRLALGSTNGTVWLMDSDLSHASSISTGRWNAFVTFTPDQAQVPEPGVLWLFAFGLVGMSFVLCKRKVTP